MHLLVTKCSLTLMKKRTSWKSTPEEADADPWGSTLVQETEHRPVWTPVALNNILNATTSVSTSLDKIRAT